jgi:hypothetical protein
VSGVITGDPDGRDIVALARAVGLKGFKAPQNPEVQAPASQSRLLSLAKSAGLVTGHSERPLGARTSFAASASENPTRITGVCIAAGGELGQAALRSLERSLGSSIGRAGDYQVAVTRSKGEMVYSWYAAEPGIPRGEFLFYGRRGLRFFSSVSFNPANCHLEGQDAERFSTNGGIAAHGLPKLSHAWRNAVELVSRGRSV